MTTVLKNDAIFLHVPKTGGWWVVAVLERMNLVYTRLRPDHADYERVFWHDRFHRDFKVMRGILRRAIALPRAPVKLNPGGFKFCFVREPLAWYESYWRFMESLQWKAWGDEIQPDRWHPLAALNGLGSPDFETFIRNVNRKRPGFVTELFGRYVRGDVAFGKQEDLEAHLLGFLRKMGHAPDVADIRAIPRINETPSFIPKPVWDPALREETMRLEYAGYVRYGYSLEPALV
jgi:hypothetical protein